MRNRLLSDILDIFLPGFCAGCDRRISGTDNPTFCTGCWTAIELTERPYCAVCGISHGRRVGFGADELFLCANCRRRRWRLDRIFAAGKYNGILEKALVRFKFEGDRNLAPHLAALMTDFAKAEMDLKKYGHIIPVPLHRMRKRERGYNQSMLLAKIFSNDFGRNVTKDGLVRVRNTPPQMKTDASQRRINVRSAFEISPNLKTRGRSVLVIDDIVTTGSTVDECAAVLKRAGAICVDVLALARVE